MTPCAAPTPASSRLHIISTQNGERERERERKRESERERERREGERENDKDLERKRELGVWGGRGGMEDVSS